MASKTLLSVVFSFRNEERNIPELMTRLDTVLRKNDLVNYEAIFVNDASTDNSLFILQELQGRYPITIVNTSRKFGVTPCVLAGFAVAKGDAIVYMDSDLQDPPEIIPEMLERYWGGADVVHTTRTHREGEGWLKMLATKLAYKLINKFSDINLVENTGDYKLLSRRVVSKILDLPEYDPYMRGLSVWVGFNQEYIKYKRDSRWGGETKFPLFSKGPAKEFIRGITSYSAAPLYISLILGLLVTAATLVSIMYAVVIKIAGVSAPGVPSLLILISAIGGAIMLSNGIIGIYIAKIYYEVKGRPRTIIESVITPNDNS